MKFADVYRRARTGWGFLVGLSLFIAVWVAVHFVTGFDADWTVLNLLLSTEASISVAVLLSTQDDSERAERRFEDHIERVAERIAQKLGVDDGQ